MSSPCQCGRAEAGVIEGLVGGGKLCHHADKACERREPTVAIPVSLWQDLLAEFEDHLANWPAWRDRILAEVKVGALLSRPLGCGTTPEPPQT